MKSVVTSALLVPPTMPWAMIQSQASSPSARSATRNGAGGSRPVSVVSGRSARTSRTSTKMNDRATVAAAPAR
jgi:hypothetical protein